MMDLENCEEDIYEIVNYCPECESFFTLVLNTNDRVILQCMDCGHVWHGERS